MFKKLLHNAFNKINNHQMIDEIHHYTQTNSRYAFIAQINFGPILNSPLNKQIAIGTTDSQLGFIQLLNGDLYPLKHGIIGKGEKGPEELIINLIHNSTQMAFDHMTSYINSSATGVEVKVEEKEVTGEEWLKLSVQLLTKSLKSLTDDKEAILSSVISYNPDQKVLKARIFNLDFRVEVLGDGSVYLEVHDYKNTSTPEMKLAQKFDAYRGKIMDLMIDLIMAHHKALMI